MTVKVEHLLASATCSCRAAETGCLFVTTAVESIDDRVLEILDKGHTRADFVEAVRLAAEAGLNLNPTFVAFTPWITREGYADLLRAIAELGLVDHVSPPVQYAIRLLVIPRSSRLLELDTVRRASSASSTPRAWSGPGRIPTRAWTRLQRET